MNQRLVRLSPPRAAVLSVRVTEAELARLNAAVVRTGLPASTLIREALRAYIEQSEEAA